MNGDALPPAVLQRKAVVYVRQSTQAQVEYNTESRRRQYELVEVARRRGFRTVEVIDDDLGRSAAGGVARAGFDRMVAEVCLGKVGAVAAREVSRFARNSRDWQQLIEMCRVAARIFGVVVACLCKEISMHSPPPKPRAGSTLP